MRLTAAALAVPAIVLSFAAGYSYIRFARLLDERLHGERVRALPRVFARPLELRRGQAMTEPQLVDRLNDLGYAQRPTLVRPGEFTIETGAVAIYARGDAFKDRVVRVVFQKPAPPARAGRRAPPRPPRPRPADRVEQLELGTRSVARVQLDAPLLTSLNGGGEREKRRSVELSAIPPRVVQAVLAIEDRRFYDHPGFDPIGIAGAIVRNLSGRNAYTAGASTITQQVARNVFLPQLFPGMTLQEARQKSWRRKAIEIWVSIVLTQRASKDEILAMYLNDMTLGQRGSFGVVGVAEAARLFFGKDVSNVTLAEAATIAGVLQSPSALSPFTNPERCRERRNVVLYAMVDAGYLDQAAADAAAGEPLVVEQRALDAEAPYFVDYVGQSLAALYPGLTTTASGAVDVYTTLDLHLQRLAQDAVRDGLAGVDRLLARRKRKGRAEAALIAVDPASGEILALVGGRSYNQSQFDRAVAARRQPGSVFKPFVFLTAFERAADEGRTDLTPASIVRDEPETFTFNDQPWTPENYEGEYDGPITFRRALAHSRNLATIHAAEAAGYDRVADLWKRLGVGTPPRPYPSIALGVFEATPLEIAAAYTIFPNGGEQRPLRNILAITRGGTPVALAKAPKPARIARPATTFLVTNMMRSVLNEGTAAGARSAGFALDAAGKTGTTNDLRDAWFAGFTPDLLTVVWVGYDDNQTLGLSGAGAALPIWTQFMKAALAGRPSLPFEAPDGVTFADIDPDTGKLAAPGCPRVLRESFAAGTEPVEVCELHRF
ncbi:MAG: PBP1A family penicillin-binding protein [Acidobacteria bacterium]|nr:PBP1A family penicillin-binding protein [Acidobacteriota bacterium]